MKLPVTADWLLVARAVLAASLVFLVWSFAGGPVNPVAGAAPEGWAKVYLPYAVQFSLAARPAWEESTDGLESWGLVGLAVDHAEPANVYALTRSRGLWVSHDRGESWEPDNRGLPDPHAVWTGHMYGNLLTMDPTDPGVLYANFGGAVHRYTPDTGWRNIHEGIDPCQVPGVAGIVVDPLDSDHIFAAHVVSGCSGGIYESFDAAAESPSWEQIASWSGSGQMENDAWTLTIAPDDPSVLFSAPPYLGFLYSVDGGHHWRRATPLGEGRRAGTVAAVHPQVTNRVIFGHPNGIHVGEYERTGDILEWSWTDHTGKAGGYIWDIDFAPSDPDVVYAVSTSGLYRSLDGGLTWDEVGRHGALFMKTLAVDPLDPDRVYIGSGKGLYVSSDGGSHLTDVTGNIAPELEVQAVAIAKGDAHVYYCNLYGVAFARSADRGLSWITSSSDSSVARTITILAEYDDPDVVFAGLERIMKSTDGGATWDESLDPGRDEQFFDLARDTAGRLYAASVHTISSEERYAALYSSEDGGDSWEGPNLAFHHRSISVGPIVPSPSGTLYVASYDYLRMTSDGGRIWQKVTQGLTGHRDDKWIDALAVDPIEPNRMYLASRSHRVFASTDAGVSWELLEAEGPQYPGRIIIDSEDHSVFYVFGLTEWYRYRAFGAVSERMTMNGVSSPYVNFRRSAHQDPLEPTRFVTGDLFRGFLVLDLAVR